MKRFLILLACLSLVAAGCAAIRFGKLPGGSDGFEVGLWVQAEGSNRTLDSADKIKSLVEQARRSGVTDIYAQVYRSGRAWYPTRFADDSPSRRAGQDPLAYLIKLSRAGPGRAIHIHAWINSFALARNKKAPILSELGEDAVLRDQYGRSLLDYPSGGKPPWAAGFGLGTPGIFLDPAHPGVRQRIALIASELLRNYPALAGIHLDFIRYPYSLPISPGSRFSPRLDFGYGQSSAARFHKETGRTAPRAGADASRPDQAAWDAWRRKQVTETVRDVRQAVTASRSSALFSAAVLPWAERAYLSAFQDWRGWLREGLLDKALVMNYSRDSRLAGQISRASIATRIVRNRSIKQNKQLIIIGLGAWLFSANPSGLWKQWCDARQAGADGVALFSYDQMAGRNLMWGFPRP